jgi:hypothetical protein
MVYVLWVKVETVMPLESPFRNNNYYHCYYNNNIGDGIMVFEQVIGFYIQD